MANKIQNKFPNATLTIYDGDKYYGFDKNSEAGALPELLCVGKAKH